VKRRCPSRVTRYFPFHREKTRYANFLLARTVLASEVQGTGCRNPALSDVIDSATLICCHRTEVPLFVTLSGDGANDFCIRI
jgi:hypothetical protein